MNLLRQICNFIPGFLVSRIARETCVDKRARTFSPWSHVVTLLYAQLTHCIGLNDVCDALGLHSGPLSSIRGATPPSRNNLSNSNKGRPAEMAEKLFWAVFEHLGQLPPRFVSGKSGTRFARKFKRQIHLVDSTTIPLIASCMDWARLHRRKAGGQMPPASGPPKLSAPLCHCGHRQACRCQASLGGVRGDQGRRNRHI